MAILTLRISDDTKQLYDQHSGPDGRGDMEKQIERFKHLPLQERVLIIPKTERQKLEALYGREIADASKFVSWVQGLIDLEVGGIRIPLSEGQLKRAQAIAHKQGRSLA